VELQNTSLQPQAQRNLCQRPALVDPECHGLHKDQGHRNRRALKVLRLASRVLGNHGDSNIEARETCETAENEEGEQEVVDGCAEAETECGSCGTYTKRDLRRWLASEKFKGLKHIRTYQIGERVQFLAHETGLLPPPSDLAVHEIEEQAEWNEA
jgi:hypothetical protein